MTPHPHLQMLERGLAAFAARDMATLRELFHEGLRWHYLGTSVLAGRYEGLDQVFELFARRAALTSETYRLHVESAIANDHFCTVIARARAERDGVKHEDSMCLVYRVEGGQVVEAWSIPGHPERERKFYG
jgi:ketosteroid isomerase-like protein